MEPFADLRAYTDEPTPTSDVGIQTPPIPIQMQIKEQKQDLAFIRHPYDSDLGRGASITIGHLPIWCEPQDIPAFLRMEPGFDLTEEEQIKLVRHLEDRPRGRRDRARIHASVVRLAMVYLHSEGLLDARASTRMEQTRAVEREVRRLYPWEEDTLAKAGASAAMAQEPLQLDAATQLASTSSAPSAAAHVVPLPNNAPAPVPHQDPDRGSRHHQRGVGAWHHVCGWARRASEMLMGRVPKEWVARYTNW